MSALDPQIARLFGEEMEAKRVEEEGEAADFPFWGGH
jgi:hypothetical protein